MTFGLNVQKLRVVFAYFSFCVGLLVYHLITSSYIVSKLVLTEGVVKFKEKRKKGNCDCQIQ